MISLEVGTENHRENYFSEISEYLESKGYEDKEKVYFDEQKTCFDSIWVKKGVVLSDYVPGGSRDL